MSASPFHVCLYVVRCDDVSVVSAVWRLCGVLCVRVSVLVWVGVWVVCLSLLSVVSPICTGYPFV